MAKSYKRTCIVCRKDYNYCMHCDEFSHLPKWMMLFHDANCREIFNTISAYENTEISKETAKARLTACDFSRKANYSKAFSKKVDDILKIEKNPFEKVETVEADNEIKHKRASRIKRDTVENIENIEHADCEEIE